MADKHLVLCGGTRLSSRLKAWREAPPVRIQLGRGKKHVHLKLHHITRRLACGLPPEAIDLLEIAAYVYAADQLVTRGGTKEFEYGKKWRRHFRMEIPVRRPNLWSQASVSEVLGSTLGFLSDDDYEFHFTQLTASRPVERYLFDEHGDDAPGYEEVMLFSGGVDSFGGAVQEILQSQRRVVLVSHRSSTKLYARQRGLVSDITQQLKDRTRKPLHVAVEINKGKDFGREVTQRSRSFLFASLAAVVARAFGLNRIRFYENGVISLNFPISPQVIGGRATRTTHPQVLAGFQKLFSLVFGCDFAVENPYQWKTKVDIFRQIKAAGLAKLCARTGSCTHTWDQTRMHTHCGRCSQCVDRRLSALAAGYDNDEDPSEMYNSDVVTGACEEAELTMVEAYIRTALEVAELKSPHEILAKFPEAARVVRHVGFPSDAAMNEVFDLYRRHASDVKGTLGHLVACKKESVVLKDYPVNSLLGVVVGRSAENAWAAEHTVNGVSMTACKAGVLVFDERTFTVKINGKACRIGNTREYHLLMRLNRTPGNYISNAELAVDVWDNERTAKNTIQRTISNLRRRLRVAGIHEILLDGKSNMEHYALEVHGSES